jgi:uncharacterized protein
MPSFVASRYNVLVGLRAGRTLAYNSMSGATAVWEPEDTAAFEAVTRGEGIGDLADAEARVRDLSYGGFVVRDDVDELSLLNEQYSSARNDPGRMVLTITPTLICNFGCDYCFQGPDKPAGRMSAAVQDRVIELVERSSDSLRKLHVTWYGGEPLLGRGVISSLSERLITLCEKRDIAYDAMIVTNGYGLSREVAQELYDHRVLGAQVTLDGAKADHDERRCLLSGRGSFERIVENMRAVVDAVPLHITVRVNIDSRNVDGIDSLLEQLAQRGFARRRTFGVYFAPVEAITEGCHSIAGACMSKRDYGALEARLTRRAFELGLTSLPYPPRFRGLCGALRPKGWVVLPSGDLHKCWDTVAWPEQRVGNVYELDRLAGDDRVMRWEGWSPFDNPVCRGCKLLPSCAGSCAHKFLNAEQTLGEAAALPCPSWKYNLKERIVFTAERSGAISADDYDADALETDPLDLSPLTHSELMPATQSDAPTLLDKPAPAGARA